MFTKEEQVHLDYLLYLRRYYLQFKRVEWDRVEQVMEEFDETLDRANGRKSSEAERTSSGS